MSGPSFGLAWLSLAQKFLGQASSPPPGCDHGGLFLALHYLEHGHAGVLWPLLGGGEELGKVQNVSDPSPKSHCQANFGRSSPVGSEAKGFVKRAGSTGTRVQAPVLVPATKPQPPGKLLTPSGLLDPSLSDY